MKTRTGLRDLLNVKTLTSLYLNKRCYSSRCKLRSAKEVTRSLEVLCPCPPHPPPALSYSVALTPPPPHWLCSASATLLHHSIQRFLSAAVEQALKGGRELSRTLQKHLLNAHLLMEYPPINALSPEPGRCSTVALFLVDPADFAEESQHPLLLFLTSTGCTAILGFRDCDFYVARGRNHCPTCLGPRLPRGLCLWLS